MAVAMALYFTVQCGSELKEVNTNNTQRHALSPILDAKDKHSLVLQFLTRPFCFIFPVS